MRDSRAMQAGAATPGDRTTSRQQRVVVALLLAVVATLALNGTQARAATRFGSYGAEAEQLNSPGGVSVDASGNVYVADGGNNRLDKFDNSGNWLLAWGSSVFNGVFEMQTCTTVCKSGLQYGSPEAFEIPTGVAVDNDPLSASYGDVYVVDWGHKRIEKFDPSGKFLLMFGGDVNEEPGAANPDVCAAGQTCKPRATTGGENGQFEYWTSFGGFIAVGPAGDVYVGDKGRVEVFEPSGSWKENLSLAGLSPTARPTSLAVDASGHVYVADEGVPGVREFEPNGTEMTVRFDNTSTSMTSVAVDAAGHVFVDESAGGFRILEYNAAGEEVESFGRNTVQNASRGLAVSEGIAYASDTAGSIWAIPVPPEGAPLIVSEAATPGLRGAATLEAMVNPEGNETQARIEYVDDAHFKESGYADATSAATVNIGATFNDQMVTAQPTLVPGTIYHYRVVATNAKGTIMGEDQIFEEVPPALIAGPWASNVAGTSVTVGARINPLGIATTYSLEITGASYARTFTGSVGEGMGFVTIARHIQDLTPLTTYHVKVVTSSEAGTWQSPERAFTTEPSAGELILPDGRQWELVTPVDKHGALIEPEPNGGTVQAAADGRGIAYVTNEPITESPTESVTNDDQVVSVHGSEGWTSQEVGVTEKLSDKENEPHMPFLGVTDVELFSADLSQLVIDPGPHLREPLSPEATERTLYIYDTRTQKYLPLVTPGNVPSGVEFGGIESEYAGDEEEMHFLAATPDLRHIVFQSPLPLTEHAIEGGCPPPYTVCAENLYEWNNGALALVNVNPEGKPLQVGAGAFLGRKSTDVIHAVSDDGRRVVWAARDLYREDENEMYERDMVEGVTKQFGSVGARFETASSDGSRVFYYESGELYVFDFNSGTTTDVTAGFPPAEHKAHVIDGFIMATSEDGNRIYFAAESVLAPGAVSGEPNVYVAHYDGSKWTTTLVATVSRTDEFNGERDPFSKIVFWDRMDARVSPNGRYLAFLSSRPLTGYDNLDAVSEQPDEEAYLYDADSNHLVCVSCNPSGARPLGIYETGYGTGPLVDRGFFWSNHWMAADIPLWRAVHNEKPLAPAMYQPRYLANSGRLFFNSSDALVPQDTNGLMDVYQYEPDGVGSCTSASATFHDQVSGCIDLISAGTSSGESAFMDASESGNDVYFVTGEKLAPEDVDASADVYDAHVCSASAPCHVPPVSPPPCTSGDSCKGPPSPQPVLFGAGASETFNGAGNITRHRTKARPHAGHKTKRCVKGMRRHRGRCVRRKHRLRRRHVHGRMGTKATRRGK